MQLASAQNLGCLVNDNGILKGFKTSPSLTGTANSLHQISQNLYYISLGLFDAILLRFAALCITFSGRVISSTALRRLHDSFLACM